MRTIQCNRLNSTITTVRRFITENSRFSFISIATNPWHALSIEAVLSRIDQATPGIVIITPHVSEGYLISSSNFSFTGHSDSLFVKSGTSTPNTLEKLKKGVEAPLSFILSTISNSDSKRRIRVISPYKKYRVLSRIFANQRLLSTFQPYYITVEYSIGKLLDNPLMSDSRSMYRRIYDSLVSFIEKIHFSVDGLDRRTLFYLQNGELIADSDVVSDYQRVLGTNTPGKEEKILFVSQPFIEQNIMTESEFKELIQYSIEFSEQNYDKLIIKPHPRENKIKLYRMIHSQTDIDIGVLEQEEAVEQLIPKINPEAIIGCTSSSLVKSSVFFEIDAYSTANIARDISTNNNFLEICRKFSQSTTGLVRPLY